MISNLSCPHCGKPIELSQALTQELTHELTKSLEDKNKVAVEQAKKETSEKIAGEMKLLKDQIDARNKELEIAQRAELELRKEKNKLDEERRTFELDKQRQMDKEREVIRQKSLEEASEKFHLKEKEKDMMIESLRKSLEEANRKAMVGSQQLQGEVLELDFEQLLRTSFPQDRIEPIAKGVLGADVRQVVVSPMGVDCGSILWENKRTKAWSDGWVTKLKNDVLADKANIPAIISEVVPDEAKSGIGQKDGVWIALPKLAIPLALLLRKSLLEVAKQKKIASNQLTKSEELYAFVTSHEFQHQVEAMISIYKDMDDQLKKERTAYERMWKLREEQIKKLSIGVAGMYGSMQGIAGQSLPVIQSLELSEETEA